MNSLDPSAANIRLSPKRDRETEKDFQNMSSITLSTNVQKNLIAIQGTADLLAQTQNRLATGKKVNSALDNPAAFFTAQGLTQQSSKLMTLMDNVDKNVQSLRSADEGMKSIGKLIESAKAAATQASASTSAVTERSTLESSVITGLVATDLTDAAGTANSLDGKSLTVKNAADGKEVTVAIGSGAGKTNTLADLNTQLSTVGAAASIKDGKLSITTTAANETSTFTVKGDAAVTLFGATDATTAKASSDVVKGGIGETSRKAAAAEFGKLMKQIDQTAKDAGFNGINLLGGDTLKATFNEKGSSSLDVEGVNMGASYLGLDGIGSDDFMSAAGIDAVMGKLENATETIKNQSSSFGTSLSIIQTRQDFGKAMVSILNEGAGNLVNADLNEEAANALALQTRMTLSQTALSLSAQSEQSVLRLLS
jgi:flagellin-like hook-associated protein FlgL